MVAKSDARERELQQRIQKLEYDLRARPVNEDGARDALVIAGQDLENWMEDSRSWQVRAENAKARLVQLSRTKRHDIGTPDRAVFDLISFCVPRQSPCVVKKSTLL